jgi:small subunit ribosomal protein S18
MEPRRSYGSYGGGAGGGMGRDRDGGDRDGRGDRGGDRDGRGGGGKNRKRSTGRRKVCRFCADKGLTIDYKAPQSLKYFISERGKLVPRRISGNCAKHQRAITMAVKRARMLALMPFKAGGR